MNQFQTTNALTAAASVKRGTEILVFKTSVADARHVEDIASLLDVHPHIIQWNVDLKDCDNVLRIISKNVAATEVEDMLLNAGYYCEELQ